MTFNKLIEKYKIEYINKLIIDTEGFDYKIIKLKLNSLCKNIKLKLS